MAVTLFPQPDSPTMPTVLPARTARRHVIDRARQAALGLEGGDQLVHLEDVFRFTGNHGASGFSLAGSAVVSARVHAIDIDRFGRQEERLSRAAGRHGLGLDFFIDPENKDLVGIIDHWRAEARVRADLTVSPTARCESGEIHGVQPGEKIASSCMMCWSFHAASLEFRRGNDRRAGFFGKVSVSARCQTKVLLVWGFRFPFSSMALEEWRNS